MTDLVHVSHGLWRPADAVADFASRTAALLTTCAEGAVVCGRSAARLHGLWVPDHASDVLEVIVHPDIPTPAERAGNRRRDVRARRRMLAPDEITMLDGIVVTTEARTWFDLAADLATVDLVACGDSVLRGAATTDELDLIVRRSGHRPGVVRARAALPYLDARSRSRPESHLRYALESSGLPRPAVNEPVHDRTGGWLAEPDLSYDDAKLALEYNGADHAGTRRMRNDITRELGLGRDGWRTEVFGPSQVFRHPDQIAAYVRQIRQERLGRASGSSRTSASARPRSVARNAISGARFRATETISRH